MAKKIIKEANAIAKDVTDNPVAVAAIAYSRFELEKSDEEYDAIAAEECGKMEAALRAIAVEDEANPVKVNWNC